MQTLCSAGIKVFVEAIQPGTELTFEMHIDNFLMNRFKKNNISLKELIRNAIEEKYKTLLLEEKQFFANCGLHEMVKYYEKLEQEGANFRMGWGSGLLNTSLSLLLDDNERIHLRRKYFKKRNHFIFPQSRKVVVKGESIVGSMGWCKIIFND